MPRQSLDFGNRGDELVTRATLHLRYTYSPALAPGASAIRIALNDDVIGTLPVTAAGAGKPIAQAIEIDPRLVVGSNRLTMTLAAAQGGTPDDAARPGLWAEVSGGSELEIAYQLLAVADDLAILPEPFFDRRDQRRVTVPFVFAAQPSIATLNAAAVVASWIGQLATWRGARFPASLETPAPGTRSPSWRTTSGPRSSLRCRPPRDRSCGSWPIRRTGARSCCSSWDATPPS